MCKLKMLKEKILLKTTETLLISDYSIIKLKTLSNYKQVYA